jgi:hypothetical protein
VTLALVVGAGSPARGGEWRIEFEPLLMDAYGHDQHVMTVHDFSADQGTMIDTQTPASITTNSGGAYRGTFQYGSGKWAWGVDYLWFNTSQDQVDLSVAAAGVGDLLVYEIADRSYVSTDPSEVLFFRVLEDTDLAIWTMDLYAERVLAERLGSSLSLMLGLRVGDFDNDYRAVVGVEGINGARQDASSNYSAMYGPLVGLTATARRGKHSVEGYLSQSIILGTAGLSTRARDFVGPYGEAPAFVFEQLFNESQDVAIPISELRLEWSYQLTRRLALSLNADTSTWWDVPVPPGVIPVAGGAQQLHENTIVFFGLGGGFRLTF